MIITEIKEIFENVEVGDIIEYYGDFGLAGRNEDNLKRGMVTNIEEDCNDCNKNYVICGKEVYVEGYKYYCFRYRKGWAIKALIKKENFITEEDLEI